MGGSILYEEKFGSDWIKLLNVSGLGYWQILEMRWNTRDTWKGKLYAIYQCTWSWEVDLLKILLRAEFSPFSFSCVTITDNSKIQTLRRSVRVEACMCVLGWKGLQRRTLPILTGKIWPKACEDISYCLGCQPRQGSRWPCLIHLSLKQTLFLGARFGQNGGTKSTGASFSQNVNPVFAVCMVSRFLGYLRSGKLPRLVFIERQFDLPLCLCLKTCLMLVDSGQEALHIRTIWNTNTCKHFSINTVCMIISKRIILLNVKN